MSRYLRRYKALHAKLVAKYRPAIRNAIIKQVYFYADNYEQGLTPNSLPKRDLEKALRSLYEDAMMLNYKAVERQIQKQVTKQIENRTQLQYVINEYYRQYLLNKATSPITLTMFKEIQKVLDKANVEGWGAKKTAQELRKYADGNMSKYHAERIVRTESGKAANSAAMLAAANTGIAVRKQWVSSQDIRTRRIPRDQYDHLHMNGKVVEFDEPFIVPSTKTLDMMQYPMDNNGSAGNIINCRCTVAFVPVEDADGMPVTWDRYKPINNNQNIFLILVQQAAQIAITAQLVQMIIEQIEQDEF